MAFRELLNINVLMFHVEHSEGCLMYMAYHLGMPCSYKPNKTGQCSTWNIGLFCWVLSVICLLFSISIQAQDSTKTHSIFKIDSRESREIEQTLNDFPIEWAIKKLDTLLVFSDKTEIINRLLVEYSIEKGYLAASIEAQKSDSLVQKFHLGKEYKWLKIQAKGSIETAWLRASDINFRKWNGRNIAIEELKKAQQKLLEQAENRGYPFAKVYLDSLKEDEEGQMSAQLVLQKGPFFTFESLEYKSPNRIPKRYLANILGIHAGDIFSRQRVLEIEKRLVALPFLQLKESPKLVFSDKTALVKLVFEEKKANRLDFLIGLLPQGGSSNRTILTGSLDALFFNALNQGERFALNLERLRPETQRADVNISAPYLFGLPFGSEVSLHLHKRDSTFLDAKSRVGISYLFQNGDQIQTFWESKSSSLLAVDTLQIIQSGRLPNALDYRKNAFGVAWSHSNLDYALNPRSGLRIDLSVSVGQNRVLRNSQIEEISSGNLDFAGLYDTLTANALRLQSEQSIEYYQPILQRSTILFAIQASGIFSNQSIFRNEQYRLGGTNSIRGFDEESIFSTRSAFVRSEYRLLLSRDAHLAAFSDYGYFENQTKESNLNQWLLSFGVGMALQTNTGQFNISIATGKSGSNNFDLRASKFHIGFISVF